MMKLRIPQRHSSTISFAMAALMVWPAVAPASDESDRVSAKLERQIALIERMTDEMLVESPNFYVQSRNETRGLYMEGHGLILSFETSLVGEHSSWDGANSWWKFWDGEDDRHVIVIDSDWEDEDDGGETVEEVKKWKDKHIARQEKRYLRGKTEIVDLLLDNAELLSSLADTDWIEVQASLRGAPYFRKKDLHRLVMRAKMGDLRAYSDGKLTEDAMIAKIQTRET